MKGQFEDALRRLQKINARLSESRSKTILANIIRSQHRQESPPSVLRVKRLSLLGVSGITTVAALLSFFALIGHSRLPSSDVITAPVATVSLATKMSAFDDTKNSLGIPLNSTSQLQFGEHEITITKDVRLQPDNSTLLFRSLSKENQVLKVSPDAKVWENTRDGKVLSVSYQSFNPAQSMENSMVYLFYDVNQNQLVVNDIVFSF